MNPAEKEHQAKDLFCSVYGHNYTLIDNSKASNRYKCKCCNKTFIMNENGDLVNDIPSFREVLSLLKFINNKHSGGENFSSLDLA